MRSWRPVRWFVLVTLGLAVALGLQPISVREILAAYVLALAAIALVVLTRLNAPDPWATVSTFEQSLVRRRPERVRPAELVRIERDLTLGSANAVHLHTRLLPLLREAAAARLAAHHHVDLAWRPHDARRLLGDDVWELLRPDLMPEDAIGAVGLPLWRIRSLIDAIERL